MRKGNYTPKGGGHYGDKPRRKKLIKKLRRFVAPLILQGRWWS